MRILSGTIDFDDCRTAVDRLLDSPSRLLPPDPVYLAFEGRRAEVAEWALGQISGEFEPSTCETVAVSKARHGVRPLQVWDPPSRLLYEAMASRLAPSLPDPDEGKDWPDFLRKPLAVTNCKYVVAADVAACYDMIDHGLLAEELRLQSGGYELVSGAIELLQHVQNKRYGLPQQSYASDILAGAFLDRIERALHRKSMEVWRYTDDFRIACTSWSDVVRSLEGLDEVIRRHGLLLNDAKTVTWKKANYEARLQEADELMQLIADEAELDIKWYISGPYAEPDDVDPEEVEILASARLLFRWNEIGGTGDVDEDDQDEHRAILQLVPTALSKLSLEDDELPDALDVLMNMLRLEQKLTPPVCRFLQSLEADQLKLEALSRFLARKPYLTDWQKWWLMESFGKTSDFNAETGRAEWLRSVFDEASNNPVLRAHAGLNLARHSLIHARDLMDDYDTSAPTIRCVVVTALAVLGTSKSLERAVRADSQIHDWLFDQKTA